MRDAFRYTLTYGFYGAKMWGDTKFKWYKPTTALEWPWVMFWMRSFLVNSNSSTLPWQQLSSVWLVCQRGPVPPHQARAKCQGVRLTIGTPNPKIASINVYEWFIIISCIELRTVGPRSNSWSHLLQAVPSTHTQNVVPCSLGPDSKWQHSMHKCSELHIDSVGLCRIEYVYKYILLYTLIYNIH